jgi:hypothetical protein
MRRQNPGGKEINHAAKQDPAGSCYGTEENSSGEKSVHGSAWKRKLVAQPSRRSLWTCHHKPKKILSEQWLEKWCRRLKNMLVEQISGAHSSPKTQMKKNTTKNEQAAARGGRNQKPNKSQHAGSEECCRWRKSFCGTNEIHGPGNKSRTAWAGFENEHEKLDLEACPREQSRKTSRSKIQH